MQDELTVKNYKAREEIHYHDRQLPDIATGGTDILGVTENRTM